jgi:hypothetical protein
MLIPKARIISCRLIDIYRATASTTLGGYGVKCACGSFTPNWTSMVEHLKKNGFDCDVCYVADFVEKVVSERGHLKRNVGHLCQDDDV